jgi:hypothetical protein
MDILRTYLVNNYQGNNQYITNHTETTMGIDSKERQV